MISVCIIGAGIGAEHLEGYCAVPEYFQVHSVCDLDEVRGQALADRHKVGFTKDFDEVMQNSDIDLVDICLPPHLHFDAIMAALDAGKAVICEKPLVGSLKQADALAIKRADTNGFLSPVFQYRFGLGTAQLRALMDAGLAGRPYAGTLETHWDRPADYYDIAWRGTWAGEQGGAILGHSIHIHDLLTSILGPVAQVFADLGTRVNEIEVEDCAALSIRMASGALITSSVTLGAADNTSRMKLMFEGFTVESDTAPYSLATKGWTFTARAPVSQSKIDAVLAGVTSARAGFAGMLTQVGRALSGETAHCVTLDEGRRSLEFVTAVYSSARNGAPVQLPLDESHPLYDGWLP